MSPPSWQTCLLVILGILGILAVASSTALATGQPNFVDEDITEDTTWDGGPYVIVDQVRVQRDAELAIEPGVQVRFGRDASLTVEGSLDGVGTADAEIVFISHLDSPEPGAYDSITLKPEGDATLVNCVVKQATVGIRVGGSNGTVSVKDCRFKAISDAGIRITKTDLSSVEIESNRFDDSPYGLMAQGESIRHARIRGNTFGEHGSAALLLRSSRQSSGERYGNDEHARDIEVTGNVVNGPTPTGIRVDVSIHQTASNAYGASSEAELSQVAIRENQVSGTSDVGILVSGSSAARSSGFGPRGSVDATLTIENVDISDNSVQSSGHGIRVWGGLDAKPRWDGAVDL